MSLTCEFIAERAVKYSKTDKVLTDIPTVISRSSDCDTAVSERYGHVVGPAAARDTGPLSYLPRLAALLSNPGRKK